MTGGDRTTTTTDDLRRSYAESILAAAGVQNQALREVYARVPRERFLGPGPWRIVRPPRPGAGAPSFNAAALYEATPDAGLAHVYQDVVVAIDEARGINNGQPSAHARWIDAAAPRPGESVLHVGCGTGYFTALLAELVGAGGRVVAVEVDPALAERGRACLAPWPQVRVECGDGGAPDGPHDVIYVNAGATHARRAWIEALAPGGRLILPLTAHLPMFPPPHGIGFVVLAQREGNRWPARVVSPVGIFDCVGARDDQAEGQLRKLLRPGAADAVRVLCIEPHTRDDRCLVHVEGACLQA